MKDLYDIALLKRWLAWAQTKGIDKIRIIAGQLPNTYIVEILDEYERPK